ncbi:hypothetical protein MKW94_005918 [Papaver nudicaule]|uniref:Conserved oligomeric Golgi complex subunit 4 n=1 Tax=Papaver nudicaule TaxID=74823 RepID=A0AA41SPC3_PAPNU|nr:hypothetical protein [Papaver nudicaule]
MAPTPLPLNGRMTEEYDKLKGIDFGSSEALEQVSKLTDIGTITRLLHECIAYQRNLDLELDNILSGKTDLDEKVSNLQKSAEVLEAVKSDSDSMLCSVRSTSDLADQVSCHVRELDLAQSRVHATLSRVDAIVERGKCIEGVKKALETQDYEYAAEFVQRFLKIDEEFGGSDDDQREQILALKNKLEGVVRNKLSYAVDRRDHWTITRFVRLFPLLGFREEGLQVYVSYLKKVISMRSSLEYENLVEQSHGRDFVECLTSLFNDIVLAVEHNDEILRNLCGEDGIVYAVIELQEECDSWGSLILRKYMEVRKLSRVESEIISYSKNVFSDGTMEGPDPRGVQPYLEEISTLTQLSETHTRIMESKIGKLRSVNLELISRATKAFRSGSFCEVVREITGFYVILEEFFMVENVRKAIKIDEHMPDSLTTSMVDDVFLILMSCCERAISTLSANSVLAILCGAMNLLSNEFQEALQHKLREPNLGAKLFLDGVGVQKAGTEIATSLNNMDVSCEFAFPAPSDRAKIESCLSELGETSTGFKQALNAGMKQLVSTVTPRIRPVLDFVGAVSYELSEAEYAENEMNDPWVQKLLHAVETYATWLQPPMTSSNYDSFVHFIIDFVVKRLEVIMMQKKFSQLGSLQLDRDVRALVSHFSGMTQRTVRDKFSRLNQMAFILNLEKVSEILDFWGENAGPVTWKLTPAEVRRVLRSRVDFKPEAIAALIL